MRYYLKNYYRHRYVVYKKNRITTYYGDNHKLKIYDLRTKNLLLFDFNIDIVRPDFRFVNKLFEFAAIDNDTIFI